MIYGYAKEETHMYAKNVDAILKKQMENMSAGIVEAKRMIKIIEANLTFAKSGVKMTQSKLE